MLLAKRERERGERMNDAKSTFLEKERESQWSGGNIDDILKSQTNGKYLRHHTGKYDAVLKALIIRNIEQARHILRLTFTNNLEDKSTWSEHKKREPWFCRSQTQATANRIYATNNIVGKDGVIPCFLRERIPRNWNPVIRKRVQLRRYLMLFFGFETANIQALRRASNYEWHF